MPSQAMQDAIGALRDRRKAGAGQAPPTLAELRATFVPGDRLYPLPDDVLVTEVTAGGVPAHWLASPGTGPERTITGGGRRLGRRRPRRRPARGHP
jgi:epsilon-lactone hydrolase